MTDISKETSALDAKAPEASAMKDLSETPVDGEPHGPQIEAWERRLGRVLAVVLVSLLIAFNVIAMFFSILRQVTASPNVVISTPEGGKAIRPARLRSCVARLRRMDAELEQESKHIWYRLRHKNRHHLTAWLDWSQDWRNRMNALNKQCPLRGKTGLPRSFQRALESMLELQKRQEKAFQSFYTDSAWLFREVREGLHHLQEELR